MQRLEKTRKFENLAGSYVEKLLNFILLKKTYF